MRLDQLVHHSKKHILGPFPVLVLLVTTGCALAEESKPLESSHALRQSHDSFGQVVAVIAGPLETDRMALLTRIQEAKGAGIGIQPYMTAFQNLESMVENGAPLESIRTRLDSLKAALNDQLLPLKQESSASVNFDTGIIGLKFKVIHPQPAEIVTIFPGTPAARAQLKARDMITHVDGCPTKDLTKEDICRMLIGPPNTKVNITIRRGDVTFNKTLTRMNMNSKDFSGLSKYSPYEVHSGSEQDPSSVEKFLRGKTTRLNGFDSSLYHF